MEKTPPTKPPSELPSGIDETLEATSDSVKAKAPLRELTQVDPEHYAIEGEFARGGLGRILRARDRRLDRPVAVKELLRDGGDATARFLREALVTARLQHPSIVPVYEAGKWPNGSPFFAMKLVTGRSLDAVLRDKETLEQRMALLPTVIAIAEAMAYAHSEGIIHRDLKPANVLVGSFGETVVIDWGLAKDLRARESSLPGITPPIAKGSTTPADSGATPGATVEGSVMGTPAYMPPEQALGDAVDERADVYAIGAVLYHVLAGAAPFSGRSAGEIVSKVISVDARPLEERAPGVPEDLAAIVRKAMARDAKARYPTAKELAEDLKRFQTGKLVSVHQYSTRELAFRWVRRNRAAVAVGGVLLAVLAGFATVSIERIVREREVAQQQRAEAERQRGEAVARGLEAVEARRQAEARRDELILAQARAAMTTDPTLAVAWLEELEPTAAGWGSARILAADAADRGVARHVLRGHDGYASMVEWSFDGNSVVSGGYDGTVRVWDAATGAARVLGEAGGKPIEAVAMSGDGKRIWTTTTEALRRWDLSTGESRAWPLTDGEGALVRVAALAPDERHVAAAMLDGTIAVVDFVSGTRAVLRGHTDEISQVTFSPDARLLASASADRTARLWAVDGSSGRVLRGHAGAVTSIGFSPDGDLVITTSEDRTVRLWDRATGAPRGVARVDDQPLGAFFAADGKRIVAPTIGGTVLLWDAKLGAARTLRAHDGVINAVTFSPDGERLATAGGDGLVHVFLLTSDVAAPTTLRGHGAAVFAVSFSPSGLELASSSADGAIRVWDLRAADTQILPSAADETSKPALSHDGDQIAWTREDGRVRVLDVPTGKQRVLGEANPELAMAQPVFSPDGKRLALANGAKVLRIVDLVAGTARDVTLSGGHAVVAVFSPDGARLAVAGYEGQPIRVLDGDATTELGMPDGRVSGLAFSPDGAELASWGSGKAIQLFGAPGAAPRALGGHDGEVRHVAFSADGRWLASGGEDGIVRVHALDAGAARTLGTHGAAVNFVTFSPDGARVASAGDDKNVRLWSVSGDADPTVLRGHTNAVVALAFSPNGDRLASAGVDSFVRLWHLATRECRVLSGHAQTVWSIAFSADGRAIASAGGDGVVRVFSDGLPSAPADLAAWLRTLTAADIGDDGTLATRPIDR